MPEDSFCKNPLGLPVIVAAFALEAILVRPDIFELYAMTLHGFVLGFLAFLIGFFCIYSGPGFWQNLLKWRWIFLVFAVTLFIVRYTVFQLKAPLYLMAVESNIWIFAVFGFAHKHLNKPGKILSYMSQGAYPIYILHMIFLFLGSTLILPLHIPIAVQFILIVLFT